MKPVPPTLRGAAPLIGHVRQFKKDRNALFRRGLSENGPVFAIKLGPQNAAVMIGPDYQQIFFMETDKKLSMNKSYRFLKAMFGEILFTASPQVYQKQRPIIHGPFKREKMVTYVRVMQGQVQKWLDSLGDEGEMEITRQINHLVQQVAGYAFMGEDFMQRMGSRFWDLYGDLSRGLDPILPPNLPLPKFRRRDQARREMMNMLIPLIQERRANPEGYDDFFQDFVTARYKDGSLVEDDTIVNMILGLMFAGHETTAGQAAWTLIELARHPEYRQQMEREINRLVPPGAPITLELLAELEHVEMAVREVERMHPSADMLLRTVEEDLDVGDYVIPAGWVVFVTSGVAHRLPEWFEQPERYDPMRYAPPREEDKRHRFALFGFGGGIHKCTGMNFAYNEMMTIAALLFQQFEVEMVTQDTQTQYHTGASRPTPTILRYRRKRGAAGETYFEKESLAA